LQLGKMMNKKDREEGGNHFLFLANQNVQWGEVNLSKISTMNFTEAERNKFDLQYGDLLICEGGEVGRTSIWMDELENCYFQKAIHRARLRERQFEPRFFLLVMEFLVKTGKLSNFIGQTSIAHLTKENLEKVELPVPSVTEQKKIALMVESINLSARKLSKKLSQTQSLKKSLMQDLLTGKVRVNLN